MIRPFPHAAGERRDTAAVALRADRLFWVMVVAGLALRLAFALLPLATHLLLLEDDAWMVTAIARNFATGHGISADGVHPTTGFHPLYPLTVGALPYLLRPDDLDFGFRANMVLCALLGTLALLPLYALLRRIVERPFALAGLALVAQNPLLVRYSVNAMETSLALLLLATLAWAWVALDHRGWRGAVALGALAGVGTLARADVALFGAAIGVCWVAEILGDTQRSLRRMAAPLLYGATATLVLLPYFARNYAVTGSLSPSSGRALAYMHSYSESFALSAGTQIAFYQSLLDLQWLPSSLAGLAVIVLVLGLVWWLVPLGQRFLVVPGLLYTAIITFYYSYLQNQGQPRYYVGVSLLLALPVALALAGLAARVGRRSAVRVAGGLVALALLLNGEAVLRDYRERVAGGQAQRAMYAAATWIGQNLPSDALLAARNSGIYQYYSRHTVLNIDGKLNHEIVPVLERRELLDYLRQQRVGYLVDLTQVCGYMEFYSRQLGSAPPHREVSSFDKLGVYASMALRSLGLGNGPQLDAAVPDGCSGAFTAAAPPLQSFPLPGGAGAVTIYALPR